MVVFFLISTGITSLFRFHGLFKTKKAVFTPPLILGVLPNKST